MGTSVEGEGKVTASGQKKIKIYIITYSNQGGEERNMLYLSTAENVLSHLKGSSNRFTK